jgi:hypothetical protein
VEGSGRGLIWGRPTNSVFIWRDWRKPRESVRMPVYRPRFEPGIPGIRSRSADNLAATFYKMYATVTTGLFQIPYARIKGPFQNDYDIRIWGASDVSGSFVFYYSPTIREGLGHGWKIPGGLFSRASKSFMLASKMPTARCRAQHYFPSQHFN